MTYWKATVEKPDDASGWTVVGVFGTSDTPGSGTARYLHGETAIAAAQLVLTHVWPVNLAEYNERKDPGRWAYREQARTGIAGHRITVEVDDSNPRSVRYDQPCPDPLVITVAELRLTEIRAQATALAEARATLKALSDQARQARNNVRHLKYCTEQAAEEALRAGVAEWDVAHASRAPRRPRKKKIAPPSPS